MLCRRCNRQKSNHNGINFRKRIAMAEKKVRRMRRNKIYFQLEMTCDMDYYKKLSDILLASSRFESESDYDTYVETIPLLEKGYRREGIRALLLALNDLEVGEIQYELIEACERFPPGMYVSELIEHSSIVRKQAPSWYLLMLQSIINAPDYCQLLIKCYLELPSDKRKELLNDIRGISEDDEHYTDFYTRMKALS